MSVGILFFVLCLSVCVRGSSTYGGEASMGASVVLASEAQTGGYRRSSPTAPNLFQQQTFLAQQAGVGSPAQYLFFQITPFQTGGAQFPIIQTSSNACGQSPCSYYNVENNPTSICSEDQYATMILENFQFATTNQGNITTQLVLQESSGGVPQPCYSAVGAGENCPSGVAGSIPLVGPVDPVSGDGSLYECNGAGDGTLQTSPNVALAQVICPNTEVVQLSQIPGSLSEALATLCPTLPATAMQVVSMTGFSLNGQQITWNALNKIGVNTALTGAIAIPPTLFNALVAAIDNACGVDGSSGITSQSFGDGMEYEVEYTTTPYCGIDLSTLPTMVFTFEGPCNDGSCQGEATVSAASYMLEFSSGCYVLNVRTTAAVDVLFGLPLYQEQSIYLEGSAQVGLTSSFEVLPSGVAIYFVPNNPASSLASAEMKSAPSSQWNSGTVIGVAAGGGGAVLLVAAAVLLVAVRRRRSISLDSEMMSTDVSVTSA